MNTPLSLPDFLENIWQTLRRASADKKHPFRYFSLGSMHASGPRQRTVALRKIDTQAHLWIYTDYRAEKISHFRQFPQASLLFFDPKKWLQVQINAQVLIHYQDTESQQIWKNISPHARKDYSSMLAPGTALSEGDKPMYGSAEKENYFCRLEFIPTHLEILQISREEHQRASFVCLENEWEGSWLVP